MKILFIITLLMVSLGLYSCSEDGIINPPDSEAELGNKLIGTWGYVNSDNYTISFYDDMTYIDSLFSYDWDNQKRKRVIFLTTGKYDITDSILSRFDIEVKYIDTSFYSRTSKIHSFDCKKINILNDTLIQRDVSVYTPENVDSLNSIWGTWSQVIWTYYVNYPAVSHMSRTRVTMQLNKENKSVKWWAEDLNGWDNNYVTIISNKMQYDPPYLDLLGYGDHLVEVEFKKDKMIWHEFYEPTKFIKIR